ncbi:ABC transporter substrate-binding protein [Psychrobacter phenylpyruvicus]|nr:ABC transporter substrate-binding protein [Psychrobacter phenylpyruvicus]
MKLILQLKTILGQLKQSSFNKHLLSSKPVAVLMYSAIGLVLISCSSSNVDNDNNTSSVQTQKNPNDSNHLSSNSNRSSDLNNLDQSDTVSNDLNVVSPDWGVAATLIAMGQPPIATGDNRVWDQWVSDPKLPSSVHDLGIRYLPNAELAAQLPVDLIIDNFFYEHSRGIYGDVPAQTIMFAGKGDTAKWEDYVESTHQLGKIINKPQQANHYINESHQQIVDAGKQFQKRFPNVKKFAVIQFVDDNNMRMYSNNSLFNVVFNKMDLQLVALGKGNNWGFVPIQMGDLTQLDSDVCLLVIKPLNTLTQKQVQDSLVWQRLGYGADTNAMGDSRCMAVLPPVWIYGGMASLTSLANNLAAANLVGGPANVSK